MDVKHVKLLLDACQSAAHLDTLLPSLPEGVTPRCVRVIEQIAQKTVVSGKVRVSDISEMLDVTRPGITLVVRQLTEMGYVIKERDAQDSRVVYVSLTEAGQELHKRYVLDYHAHLTEVLSEIGDEGAEEIASAISRVVQLITGDTKANRAE